MKKKLLAIIMTMALVVSMIPMTAFAGATTPTTREVGTIEALQTAIKDLNYGDTIKLTDDIDGAAGNKGLDFKEKGEVTLDLNGNSLTITGLTTKTTESDDNRLTLTAGDILTIKNGDLELNNKNESESVSTIRVSDGATLTLENVNYVSNGAAIFPDKGSTVNIIGGSVTGQAYCVATNATYGSSVNINIQDASLETIAVSGCPIFINTPGQLNLKNVDALSKSIGAIVRGGTAVFEDVRIQAGTPVPGGGPVPGSKYGNGTDVPFAGIFIGNQATNTATYQYPSNVTFKGSVEVVMATNADNPAGSTNGLYMEGMSSPKDATLTIADGAEFQTNGSIEIYNEDAHYIVESTDPADVLAALEGMDTESLTSGDKEAINDATKKVVEALDKSAAAKDPGQLAELRKLDSLFLDANSNLTEEFVTPVIDPSITDEANKLPSNDPITFTGLALSSLGAKGEVSEVTRVKIDVDQLPYEDDGKTLVIDAEPMISNDGSTYDLIPNSDLKAPVTFSLYLPTGFLPDEEYVDVKHIKDNGSETYKSLAVKTDVKDLRYVEITVTEFSKFLISEAEVPAPTPTPGDDAKAPKTGDNSNIGLFAILGLIALAGIGFTAFRRKTN